MMLRVADVIADLLAEAGVRHVFMVTGGGAMHLNDAFGRHPGLEPVFCHHEQACAMAAESYGRLSNRLAAVNVTTGPGGLNALNGVFGAYTDSVGMVVVSGQVKRETTIASTDLPLRQLGDQEVDITAVAAPITKLATVLDDAADTRRVVERAIWLARHGRPGPVWVDVPSDIQATLVDPAELEPFDAASYLATLGEVAPLQGDDLEAALTDVLARLAAAKRPVVMVGTGVRTAGAHDEFLRVIEKLGVPVVTAFNAHDLVPDEHPLYAGRPGTVGDRPGNFAVQNADLVLVLGCRLNIRQISYNWENFARAAYKVMIDIDAAELAKPTLSIDDPVHADLREALTLIDKAIPYERQPAHEDYLAWCRDRVGRYAMGREASPVADGVIDPYSFLAALFERLADDDVVVTGDGTACVVTFQVARIRAGQRLYSNSGSASMGYDLPAAVGAAVARGGGRVVCVAGDGSIMMNLQELQTIVGRRLHVKVVLVNNGGYSSIRQTQTNYFPDGLMGCDPDSGVTFPSFATVATAFGLPSHTCADPADTAEAINWLLEGDEARLLEVVTDRDRPFAPKLASRQLPDGRMVSSPLEDMAPFLSRDELAENMLIPPLAD